MNGVGGALACGVTHPTKFIYRVSDASSCSIKQQFTFLNGVDGA
ncbi:hypothetical protein FDUTEX481_07276 [Tolypothrix sp. PCC 7601]|nr:hypothetical protein FDUTEX481_07276 [Tolypothrix sp. PCC 7601]